MFEPPPPPYSQDNKSKTMANNVNPPPAPANANPPSAPADVNSPLVPASSVTLGGLAQNTHYVRSFHFSPLTDTLHFRSVVDKESGEFLLQSESPLRT